MQRIITPETYFNPNGEEILDEKIYGGNPTGFLDFNRPRYQWSKNLYDLLVASFWTMGEVNTSKEKKDFSQLTENEQNIYKYTFGQLSFNDSIQSFYLTDFQSMANNSIIKAVLIKQAETEVLHSQGYSTLLDACGNSNEVFDLYKTDEMLARKNYRIAKLFAENINGSTSQDMLLSAIASVCLEGIFFLTGFSFIYTLGDKVPGGRDTIVFIHRDENLHLAMFANITKTIASENQLYTAENINKINDIMAEAVDIELEYGKYLINRFPILGLREDMLIDTVYNYGNERLKAIGLETIFPSTPKTHLQKLVDKGSNINDVRTNMFEGNVAGYAKDSINLDDF